MAIHYTKATTGKRQPASNPNLTEDSGQPSSSVPFKRTRLISQLPRGTQVRTGLWGEFINKVSPHNFTKLIQDAVILKVDPQGIRNYFEFGGNHNYLDGENNSLPHLLAKHHSHWSFGDSDTIESVFLAANTMMHFYHEDEVQSLCQLTNFQGRTPWHELIENAKERSEFGTLSPAGRAIAAEFMKAGASPLQSLKMEKEDDCPALALLPYIKEDEELLSLVINTAPQLTICSPPSSVPALKMQYPNLLSATVHQKMPGALNLLIKQGAQISDATSPVRALTQHIMNWDTQVEFRECAQVLIGQGIFIKDGVFEGDLIAALELWKIRLAKANDAERQNIKDAIRLLLHLFCDLSAPVQIHLPKGGGHQRIQEGMKRLIRSRYPELWALRA